MEGRLLQILTDLYPMPKFGFVNEIPTRNHWFDDLVVPVVLGHEEENANLLYRTGLRRGFTLVGCVPGSLNVATNHWVKTGLKDEFDIGFTVRFGVTLLVLAGMGVVLALQSRWLGVIGWYSSRGHATGVAPGIEPEGATKGQQPAVVAARQPEPGPVPVPLLVHSAGSPVKHPAGPAARPFVSAPEAAAAVPEANGQARGNDPGQASAVLIADADRTFALELARVLSSRGYFVLMAGTASEALSLSRQVPLDLVILDTALPDRSGIALCHDLRSVHPGPERPVLIATSNTATAQEIGAMASSADDYMVKPYVIEALILRIHQHLKSRRPA
jgi:CheY-like chemotaxis protein